MRRFAVVALVVAVAIDASATASTTNLPRVAMDCAHQSFAKFPHGFSDSRSLVVGPLAWQGAAGDQSGGAYMGGYRWKNPVIVRPGHTVTIRIGGSARSFAGLQYSGGKWDYVVSARTVVFKPCSARKAGSSSDRGKVTFWAGGIVSKRTRACVPVEIRIDRGRVHHRMIALGNVLCGQLRSGTT